MRYVVADTNALIAPFKLGFNIDSRLDEILGTYRMVIPEAVMGELRRLASTNQSARAALKYAGTKEVMGTGTAGDAAVLELARRLKGYVMTNDQELIRAARKMGLGVIRLREKSRLVVEGGPLL